MAAQNPLAWIIEVNGLAVDARHVPVGAENVVTAVDLVFPCWTTESEVRIRLQENSAIRHCQYLCYYDSLTWGCSARSAGSLCCALSDRAKDAEILILRHQVAVLQR